MSQLQDYYRQVSLPGMNALRSGFTAIRRMILPSLCLTCDRLTGTEGRLCASCWQTLRFIDQPYCEVLGSPFAYDIGKGALSAEAIANPPVFDRARSVVLYDDVARQLVQGLKFSDRTDLAPWMAQWMVAALARDDDRLLRGKPLVVPVPLHRNRLMARRFNQSAELARALAQQTGQTYAHDLLIRIRPTRQQVGLGARERHRNVEGAFRVPKDAKLRVQHASILLVDDVYTTGATLQACARALKRAGASQINCLTFARVAPGDM